MAASRQHQDPRTLRRTVELYRAYRQVQMLSVTEEGDDLLELLPGDTLPPDVAVQQERLAALLRDLMECLTPSARDELVSRFGLDGHPPRHYKDLALTRGVTPKAIQQQWVRSREILRRALRSMGIHGVSDL